MNKRVWTLVAAVLLLIGMLAVGVAAEEETTVTFAPYTDADGVRQYCACGNKFVADENGTVAYVNGENGCKNHKENGVITAGCDGTLISWSPVSGSNKDLSGNAGKGFYLTGSTSLANANTCGAAGSYYIDLNGNLLYRNNSRVMTMVAGSNLYITDTSAKANGNLRCRNTNSTSHTGQGMVLWMNGDNISITLFAGNIDGEKPTSYTSGGAAIFCNKATGKVNVFGGTVKAGTVTGGNAGVAMLAGTFNLYGGNVTGGSGVKGGAIYVGSSATLNIEGGTITGGTASNQGGAVYNDGTVNMSGGKIIRGTNVATAVVYNMGTFNLTGGTVDGTTAGDGAQKGAIMTGNGSELIVNGGTVTGNPKSIYAYAATVKIQSGTVDGNQLYINGGSTINVTGGTVEKEIYLKEGSVAEISGTAKVLNSLNFFDETSTVTIGTLTEGAEVSVKTLGYENAVIPYYIMADETAIAYMHDHKYLQKLSVTEEGGLYVSPYAIQACSKTGALIGFDSWEKALSDTTEGVTYYKLTDSVDGGIISKDILLDLNGKQLTNVTIPEGVTLSGMDSTTDDYDCTEGYGTITGTVNGVVATNIRTTAAEIGSVKRYLAVNEEGVISFHRFYMGVTHMSLRPGVTGVGYKALFCGDSVVKTQLTSYGYNLWVGEGEKLTASKTEFNSGATVSLRLQNFDVANYGEANVNASVYMQFANGATVESDTYSYTLRSLLETINGSVGNFTETQMTALQTMCQENADAMSGWDIANILSWTATEAA